MSDLHHFDAASKAEMTRRLDEFVARCGTVLQVVYQRRFDERQVFEQWLRGLIVESENPFWILHEHPLYVTAEYLGLDLGDVEIGPFGAAYIRLAQSRNW
jgi:hypothetical protein